MTRRSLSWVFIVLALAAVAARVIGLHYYPALNPDEGFWAGGARNFVLFGTSVLDGRLHPFLSPGEFTLLSGWFSIVPPSLFTARAFAVLTGLITCALIAVFSLRQFPRRPWLFPLLFAFTAFTLLIHRVALLEAHQTMWLVVAALLWLSAPRRYAAVAGAAFGCALLVKSNSLYLLPAFLLTLPRTGEKWSGIREAALFVTAVVIVGGGGYALARAIDPLSFDTAFRYELDGVHFLDGGDVFRIGRFGLHPAKLLSTVVTVVKLDPFFVLLAGAGLVLIVANWTQTTREARFFALWLVMGAVFHLAQIYIEVRYFSTLAPAMAFCGAVAVSRMLDVGGHSQQPWRRAVAASVLLVFLGFNGARIARGIMLKPNAGYWELVSWMSRHVPAQSNVLVSPGIGISLPQRSYDFYRLITPYSGQPGALSPIVERLDIGILIFDAEWQVYATPDTRRFIAERCELLTTIDGIGVYRVRPNVS